ncbi:hypothetical protein [Pedobacter lusitanus]|uniref:hypothetical protein n=1 Tax=Pedobacter lusitanus TaxID=1503925 RepID=UPI00126A48E1|nr:hypothetical protein [Pedobacter lusitanus]
MFDILNKYRQNGHFFLISGDELNKTCNAPEKQVGVFLVYALKNGKIEIVFIGGTGDMNKRKLTVVQNTGTGGLKDELINGPDTPRKILWPGRMEEENIEALDIYWYITLNEIHNDSPGKVENWLFERHYELFHRLPRWNFDL